MAKKERMLVLGRSGPPGNDVFRFSRRDDRYVTYRTLTEM